MFYNVFQVFGSGYAWLVADLGPGCVRPKLAIVTTANQDLPPANQVPLLVIDVVRAQRLLWLSSIGVFICSSARRLHALVAAPIGDNASTNTTATPSHLRGTIFLRTILRIDFMQP